MADNQRRVPLSVTRDESVRLVEENRSGVSCCSLLFIIVYAITLGIGIQMNKNTSSCYTDGTDYIVDLRVFLIIAGAIPLGFLFLSLLQIYFSRFDIDLDCFFGILLAFGACCLLPFILIWSALGLFIYVNQMNSECQHTASGKMILTYGVIGCIIFAPIFIGTLCVCFKDILSRSSQHSTTTTSPRVYRSMDQTDDVQV